MKARFLAVAVFIPFASAIAFGQQAKLEGYVSDVQARPVSNVRVIAPGGQAALTDNRKGHFTINFPASVQPGQATRIEVTKANWVIFHPMLGKCVTQSTERNYEPLRVVIVPKGSGLALSPSRLSQVITQWSRERVKLRDEVKDLKKSSDEYSFLREYAEEYGFTLEEFRAAAGQWAQIKDSDDKEERALKEYWQKNYAKAAQLATESALSADDELREANKRTTEASLKVIRRYQLAGNAYYAEYKFREALAAYNEIAKRFEAKELSRERHAADWAQTNFLIGNAKQALGIRVGGEEAPRLLKEALAEYQKSASFYTREQSAQDWAKTQNNLGMVLMNLGERVSGTESIKYLNEAVAADRAVLDVTTRERFPQRWAEAQNNLGLALTRLGERVSGTESINYLNEAVTAHRRSLEVKTREQSPQDWAASQNNLGLVLLRLGERVGAKESIKYLHESAAADRRALEVRTREQFPREWAVSQNNLGVVFMRLGERASAAESIKYLNEAVTAFRAALEISSREQSAQDWANTQSNLGGVLMRLGERVKGAESIKYLNEAVVAHRRALEVRTREQFPQDWAVTQSNLCAVLIILSDQASANERIKYLSEAVASCRAALDVRTREHLPQDWAATQTNLGVVLTGLGERVTGEESINYLSQALEAYRSALEVRTREQFPQDWATTQHNLGLVLTILGMRKSGAESNKYLNEAVEAYRAALELVTPEQLPHDWARVQNNLAATYFQLGDWSRVSEVNTKVLAFDPDNEQAYRSQVTLLNDRLFKFDDALLLHQQWLARHPEHTSAQLNLAEAYFTVGRFAESRQRISSLLTLPAVGSGQRIALRGIEIAILLAEGKTSQVAANIDAVIAEVATQPAEFKLQWDFDGAKRFVEQNESLSPYRAWLVELFNALARKDRTEMLNELKKARAAFKK